jgi:hypothetical protein
MRWAHESAGRVEVAFRDEELAGIHPVDLPFRSFSPAMSGGVRTAPLDRPLPEFPTSAVVYGQKSTTLPPAPRSVATALVDAGLRSQGGGRRLIPFHL